VILNFKKFVFVLLAVSAFSAFAASKPASALEYFELEVYGHQTAAMGEREFENASTFSDPGKDSKGMFRSSFELNYGLTNNLELAAYTDFQGTQSTDFSLAAVRVRARYSFFEKNQLPVDLGVYGELAFPRGEDAQMEGEIRGIVEKDFDRLNLAFNPIIERKLVVKNNAATDVEFAASTSVGYRIDKTWHPHLDLFGQLGEVEGEGEDAHGGNELLLMPAVDVRVARNFMVGAHAGFGLTDATEKALGGLRVEYEF
jgi:hypothetical protein